MECNDTITKIDLMLDGEMTEDEKRNFLKHLKKCEHCESKFEMEKCFRDYLQKALAKKQVSPGIADDIRSFVTSHI